MLPNQNVSGEDLNYMSDFGKYMVEHYYAEVEKYNPDSYTCNIKLYGGGRIARYVNGATKFGGVPIMMIGGGPSSYNDDINIAALVHGERKPYKKGDKVIVIFMGGSYEHPIILGSILNHYLAKLTTGNLIKDDSPGDTNETEKDIKIHSTGTNVVIDKNGKYTIMNKDGKTIVSITNGEVNLGDLTSTLRKLIDERVISLLNAWVTVFNSHGHASFGTGPTAGSPGTNIFSALPTDNSINSINMKGN